MRKITLLIAVFLIFGCSKDDSCSDKEADINSYYDIQIETVKNSTNPNGIDYDLIKALEKERDKKIHEACN